MVSIQRRLPLAAHVSRVLALATVATGWKSIGVVVEADAPVALGAAVATLARFLTNVVHGFLSS